MGMTPSDPNETHNSFRTDGSYESNFMTTPELDSPKFDSSEVYSPEFDSFEFKSDVVSVRVWGNNVVRSTVGISVTKSVGGNLKRQITVHDRNKFEKFRKSFGLQGWEIKYADNSYSSNSKDEKLKAQVGGTCYAHAVTMCIRATLSRIVGRVVPSHNKLVNEIIRKHGSNGGYTYQVLKEQCKQRNLGCSKLNTINEIKNALNKNRIIIGTFWMNEGQWNNFCKMFNSNSSYKNWVCEKHDIGSGYSGEEDGGHAIAIVGYGNGDINRRIMLNKNSIIQSNETLYWKIKNSWGNNWGDDGHFRLVYDAIAGIEYYDVYFKICDLTYKDKENYKSYTKHGYTEDVF